MKNESKYKFGAQLLRGGIEGLLVRAGSILAGLVASVTLARILGPESYGIYAFVFSLITILGLPVKMGLPTLILRETARADQANDDPLMRGIWCWSDKAMALMTAAVLLLSGLYLWFISGVETPRMAALLFALPLVPLIGLAEARGAAIRGLRRVALGVGPDMIMRPLLLAGVVALIALWSATPLSVAQVYALHVGVGVITLALAVAILARIRPRLPGEGAPRTMPRAWIGAILPLSVIAGTQVVSQNTDILMLGALATDAEVGLYRVALSGANIALFALTTANLVLQPYFARAWASGDLRLLQKLTTVGARVSVTATVPMFGFFLLGGTWLLKTIYGDSYAGAYWPLIVLTAGQLFTSFFGMVGVLLMMTGREWVALCGLFFSAVANVLLNWLLIPRYGIEGAAFATAVSIVIWNICLWGAAWVLLRIDTSPIGLHYMTQLKDAT